MTTKTTTVRILADCHLDGIHYPPNCLVTVPEAQAESLIQGGKADANPEAVDYCKTQGIEAILHSKAVKEP